MRFPMVVFVVWIFGGCSDTTAMLVNGDQLLLSKTLETCLQEEQTDSADMACLDLEEKGYASTIGGNEERDKKIRTRAARGRATRQAAAAAVVCEAQPDNTDCEHSTYSDCLKDSGGSVSYIWQKTTSGSIERCCFVNCTRCKTTITRNCEIVDSDQLPERVKRLFSRGMNSVF